MTETAAKRKRPNYGIDAPTVVRNLILGGAAAGPLAAGPLQSTADRALVGSARDRPAGRLPAIGRSGLHHRRLLFGGWRAECALTGADNG